MIPWTGIALAPRQPGDDAMGSRLSTYLHPLAGRPVAWFALQALARLQPPPAELLLLGSADLAPELFPDLPAGFRTLSMEAAGADGPEALPLQPHVLLADAAAPLLHHSLQRLLAAVPGTCVVDDRGRVAAAWVTRDNARSVVRSGGELCGTEFGQRLVEQTEATVVRSRASMARAAAGVRGIVVQRLMERGVTFLLPDTVWIDVDVQIGRDSIIYPGVVLEGQTEIGEETVIGPGCRILDARVGSGVEMKGWNYISRTFVRNRAILEPYVRRGFD